MRYSTRWHPWLPVKAPQSPLFVGSSGTRASGMHLSVGVDCCGATRVAHFWDPKCVETRCMCIMSR